MGERKLVLVAVLLAACSSAAPPKSGPPAGGEGGDSESGGSGGSAGAAGKGGAGSGGTGGRTVTPDAAPVVVEKDAGTLVPDATAPADQAPAGQGGSGGGEALMVVGTVPIIGSDVQIQEQLIARGFKVTPILDSMSSAQMAMGKKIVVLSYSIDSEEVTGKFNDVEASVIVMEHNLLPSLGMTTGAGHGYQLPSTQISIINAEHPLAAGFMGDVTVISVKNGDVFWGVPAESAVKIATVKGNANRVVLFGYEAGAMMVGKKAPGKRLQFFLGAHNVPTKYLTAEGLKMLDASIDWCAK